MADALTDYTYKKTVTIDTTSSGANITGTDQSNFPVCIAINSSSWAAGELTHFFDAANTNGKRVQFFDSDGTTNLAYEVEKYDSANQSAVYWVKKPTITKNSKASGNGIIVAYGSFAASDQSQGTSVWDSNYKAVWHMPGANGNAADSTSNGLTLTDNASSTTYTGYVAGGVGFDGTDDYFSSASDTLAIPTALSLEAWVKWTGDSQDYTSIISREGSSNWGYTMLIKSTNKLAWYWTGRDAAGNIDGAGSALSKTAWSYIAMTVAGTANGSIRQYVNGSQDASSTTAETGRSSGSGLTTLIGKSFFGSREFNGQLDEVRISNVQRSADWIKATYYSMFTPASGQTFNGGSWLAWSAEESTGASTTYATQLFRTQILNPSMLGGM